MGTPQRGGDLLAPVAAVRRFYQTMSTRGWEWRTPKVEREIRGVKFAPSSILAADSAAALFVSFSINYHMAAGIDDVGNHREE